MAEKIEGWKDTCERFVAFLDIMGFKDMVFRENHRKVKDLLESLYPSIEVIKDNAKKALIKKALKNKGDTDKTHSVVFPILFSDSIILLSSNGADDSASEILLTVAWVLTQALKQGIPMKGAIAYGEQTAILEKSLFFGKPFIDAFELQNELQLYGVVLHHTMEQRLNTLKLMDSYENNDFFRWDVSMKTGKISHYIVDWSVHYKDEKELQDTITKLYYSVSGTPRMYVDNTKDFTDKILPKIRQKRLPF